MFFIGVVVGIFIGWIVFERPKVVTEFIDFVKSQTGKF